MNAADAVIVSARRLLVDALTHLTAERLGLLSVAAESGDDLTAVITSNPDVLVVIDLESPDEMIPGLQAALAQHAGRRCGVYDRFTARIAERAFDLGIGVPVSLRSTVDVLVDAFGGTTETGVVTAVGPTCSDLDRLARLSPRELEVMQCIAGGNTSVSTAGLLSITPHTVDTHRRRAMRKLDASTQSQAIALLARVGALSGSPVSGVSGGDRASGLRRPS